MKKIWLMLLATMLVLSACAESVDSVEQADHLVRIREYEEATDLYKQVLEEDESNMDAWHGYIKVLLREKEYNKARTALESYYEAVTGAFSDLTDDEAQVQIAYIMGYADALINKDKKVGSWYQEILPPELDLYSLPYQVNVGEKVTLDVPEGTKVYWTLDGSDPDVTDDTQLYEEPITINFEGDGELRAVAVNELGISSDVASTWIYGYAMPDALKPSVPGGTYEGGFVVEFPNYDYDTMDLYYTLDGSDPEYYGKTYNSDIGIALDFGEYTLVAYYYDYNTGQQSEQTTIHYSVANPYELSAYTEVNVAILEGYSWSDTEVESAFDRINSEIDNLYVNYYMVYDLERLKEDLLSGYAQAVFMDSSNVEELAGEGLISPLKEGFNLNTDDYLANAPEAGRYNDAYYTLPVTIRPKTMLYYNSDVIGDGYGAQVYSWEDLTYYLSGASATYNLLYASEDSGHELLSWYLGYGGSLNTDGHGDYILEEQPLTDALAFAEELSELYGTLSINKEDFDYSVSWGESAMLLINPEDLMSIGATYTYNPAGAMPLPNGAYAMTGNTVDGLHVTSNLIQSEDGTNVVQILYSYLAKRSEVNYIAGYDEAIPALSSQIDTNLLYLYGSLTDYQHAVENGYTLPDDGHMSALLDKLSDAMDKVISQNDSAENVASALAGN